MVQLPAKVSGHQESAEASVALLLHDGWALEKVYVAVGGSGGKQPGEVHALRTEVAATSPESHV